MDKKIEVDPRLFITCRLCLDELGIYQIVPSVKEQISYCFDINVEPFDGLPQLICKKCEAILNNYAMIKKTVVTKQKELLIKIKGCSKNQSPEKGSLVSEHKGECENIGRSSCSSKKRRPCISSSTSDSERENESNVIKNTNGQIDEHLTTEDASTKPEYDEKWALNYKKYYVCRACDSPWVNKKLVLEHFDARHSKLKKRYNNIFKNQCEVKLYQFGNKLNMTGSPNNVMLSKSKILINKHPKFYIMYAYKNDSNAKSSLKGCKRKNSVTKNESNLFSDSSDDDVIATKRNKRRLYSRSSNETVILEDGSKANARKSNSLIESPKDTSNLSVCINIVDSSDSELENKGNKTKAKDVSEDPSKTDNDQKNNVNVNAIDEIISACKNKYVKKRFHSDIMLKSNKTPLEIAIQLKRKFLNFGRKIINNKKSINCTPLLRFLEHKNADIIWIPRSLTCSSGDTNLNNIRIMSRIKNTGENELVAAGWVDYYERIPNAGIAPCEVVSSTKETERKLHGIENLAGSYVLTVQNEGNAQVGDTKKLLNSNPVANPKQLPKKILNNNEVKSVAKKHMSDLGDTPNDFVSTEMCLPIITSTTSLAKSVSVDQIDDNNDSTYQACASQFNDNNFTTAQAPKFLKVKPVTELMSQETLNRMKEPNAVAIPSMVPSVALPAQVDHNNMINIYMPNMNVTSPQCNNTLQINNLSVNVFQPEVVDLNNYVILDTVELPHTKTNSPFDYFRKLLQVHNITLLDIDTKPSQGFNCLLKFKVFFKQEPEKQPVILSLSLSCSKNMFLLSIKDRHQENINVAKISANWQWEVLKVFKGEVVNKLLANAQKVSAEVYEYTSTFLCLLKSINNIKPS